MSNRLQSCFACSLLLASLHGAYGKTKRLYAEHACDKHVTVIDISLVQKPRTVAEVQLPDAAGELHDWPFLSVDASQCKVVR